MRTIHRYSVQPAIPPRLACLQDLAYNLRFTWDHETMSLFQRLDDDLWERTGHNPVALLLRVSQLKLDRAADDDAFLAHLDRVCTAFNAYLEQPGWFRREHPEATDLLIAYFSMEYGLAECLPIYSGGLGVLAGDHLKTASEMDIPLVGVGLLYEKGYFKQYLNEDGWQLERYENNDFQALPLRPVLLSDGGPLTVQVELAERTVHVAVWLVRVGRVSLYLLDTNLPENDPRDHDITDELYGGGPDERLRQEIVLGIGGMRALGALSLRPQVCHMNEGHSAFLSLERVRELMKNEGLDYQTARQVAGAGTIFTTHTPVPAGFDLFPSDLMGKYFSGYVKELGLTLEELLSRGRIRPHDPAEPFNVAALATRNSRRRNAVSRLHRRVTAHMMQESWKDFPETDIPIDSVTNGAHVRGWIAAEMAGLLERYAGPRWQDDPADKTVWERVDRIPDEELWRAHVRQRERLVAYARQRLEAQAVRRNAPPTERQAARQALRSDALTIGFARRFATYKRATLLLNEPQRLKAILLDDRRPVQIIFAGKAHPRDDAGKEFIRQLIHFARQEGVQHRLVFVEDYDLGKAQMLVQGADVWLNTPRRPLEASGTSGMKALMNGVLNLSVLDGWWAEGYHEGAGWAIGNGEEYTDFEYQDRVESQALFSILEEQVIPLFYERGPDGIPRGWTVMMRESMSSLVPAFSSRRMLREYLDRFYLPAGEDFARLSADGFARARQAVEWKARIADHWADVSVVGASAVTGPQVNVGDRMTIEARVKLGALTPADVRVEAYHGTLTPEGSIADGGSSALHWGGEDGGVQVYQGTIATPYSGEQGFAVRILPAHDDVLVPNELAYITWE